VPQGPGVFKGRVRYKALLIGASNYGSPGIEPLPFVPDDLERMADAFVRCGFHQANVAQFPYATPNEINGEVTRFLGAAERTWTERVTTHLAWKLTAPEQAEAVLELKEACRRLTRELTRSCAIAEDDFPDAPWYDGTLAERTTERVGFPRAAQTPRQRRHDPPRRNRLCFPPHVPHTNP
jgi:hypothetical protein